MATLGATIASERVSYLFFVSRADDCEAALETQEWPFVKPIRCSGCKDGEGEGELCFNRVAPDDEMKQLAETREPGFAWRKEQPIDQLMK